MSPDEHEIIAKAKRFGAIFKRETQPPKHWYVSGEPYAFKTRLEAAHDYLEQHAEMFKTIKQRITEAAR